jgi:hypothetical protein
MIVKNEEHIILDTLKNLLNYIQFDYWVISDTGSTDNTKNIIRDFFSETKIPGELVEHEWVDFAYNRTRALECAFNKTDYLFIFDADDSINGDFKLPLPLTYDLYQVIFGKVFSYVRPLLITNRKRWKFNGVLHEFLSSVDVMINGEMKIDGNYYVESGRSGNRSKNPNKYLDDAIILKNAFEKEINGGDYGMACRYAFYCAQSYKDSGFEYYDDSIEWYKKVLELKGWNQEKYYACYTIGNLYENKKNDENAIKYWLKTIEYDSERIEGIVNAVEYYRNTGLNIVVNALYHKFKNYNCSLEGKLFITWNKYNDELEYHNSISAYYVGDFESGYLCCKKILINSIISENLLYSTLNNIFFYKNTLENDEDSLLLFYKVDEILSNISKNKNHNDENLYQLWNILFEKNRKLLTKYNSQIIETFKNKENPKIFISFTSCKRYHLFSETINSIINHWEDIHDIDYWFCVDDNSSEEDRIQMKKKYSWIDYYMNMEKEKGHRNSMNIIWNKLNELKPTYWIHMEDDFIFHSKMQYISHAIAGLECCKNEGYNNVCQMLFNRNYSETIKDYNIKSHINLIKTQDYVVHEHKQGDFNYLNNHYWPYFSFRPSLINVEAILGIGNFDSDSVFFEKDYAEKWYNSGYKSAFLNKITNRHVGRLTCESKNQNIKNAYELNEEKQFNFENNN